MVVEGEPGDVDLAGGLEDAGRDVEAVTRAGDHHFGGVCAVETLVGAGGWSPTSLHLQVLPITVDLMYLFFNKLNMKTFAMPRVSKKHIYVISDFYKSIKAIINFFALRSIVS